MRPGNCAHGNETAAAIWRVSWKMNRQPRKAATLKQLNHSCTTRSSSEPAVTRKQRRAQLFRKYDVGCVVSGKIVTAPPDLRQQHEMGVSRDAEVLQIKHCILSAARRNGSFPRQAPQNLRDFKIKEVRRMQRFVARIDAVFNALARRCLKKPVHCGRGIENDHRISRSSRTMRAESTSTETGFRWCRRSRNSASVGRSAISLISASR